MEPNTKVKLKVGRDSCHAQNELYINGELVRANSVLVDVNAGEITTVTVELVPDEVELEVDCVLIKKIGDKNDE